MFVLKGVRQVDCGAMVPAELDKTKRGGRRKPGWRRSKVESLCFGTTHQLFEKNKSRKKVEVSPSMRH